MSDTVPLDKPESVLSPTGRLRGGLAVSVVGLALLALAGAGVAALFAASAGSVKPVLAPPHGPEAVIRGRLSGPGYRPGEEARVFATLNDNQAGRHNQLSSPVDVGQDGTFVLTIPSAVLTPHVTGKQRLVNVNLFVLTASGRNSIYGAILAETPGGDFARWLRPLEPVDITVP